MSMRKGFATSAIALGTVALLTGSVVSTPAQAGRRTGVAIGIGVVGLALAAEHMRKLEAKKRAKARAAAQRERAAAQRAAAPERRAAKAVPISGGELRPSATKESVGKMLPLPEGATGGLPSN
jgi:hypothetical protein